jgi:hypothetical protein
VVAILDSRVSTKFYGHLFLEALPPITRRDGPLHTLPAIAERFLAGNGLGIDGDGSVESSRDDRQWSP